jgi:hypothetical protein
MHRIDLAREENSQLTDKEYSRWRDVWRAMLFLDTLVHPSPAPDVLGLIMTDGLQLYWAEQHRSPRRPATILG